MTFKSGLKSASEIKPTKSDAKEIAYVIRNETRREREREKTATN